MFIKVEVNGFNNLMDMCWNGAINTLEDIENANKERELMDLLDTKFYDSEENPPEDIEVNDYLWHERDSIYEELGLNENGELKEEEEEEEE